MILLRCSISLFLNMRKNILRERLIRPNNSFHKIKGKKKKEEEEEEKEKGRKRSRMKRKREISYHISS